MHAFGPYHVTQVLQQRRFFQVVCAKAPDGRDVIVKCMAEGCDAPNKLALLLEEGRLLMDLSHPHIRRLLDMHFSPHAQILEYIDGAPLAHWLEGARRQTLQFAWPQLAAVVDHIASALVYLEQRHIMHGDVTPDNILVARSGRAVLIDFTHGSWPGRRVRPVYDVIAGKEAFAPPEVRAGKRPGPPADVFQLAVTTERLLNIIAADDPAADRLQRRCQPILRRARHLDPAQRLTADAFALAWSQAVASLRDDSPVR